MPPLPTAPPTRACVRLALAPGATARAASPASTAGRLARGAVGTSAPLRRCCAPLPRRRVVLGAAADGQASGERPLRVLVTGGTKGIGRALCEAFLAAGDDVVFCSRDPARVAAVEAELRAKATVRPGQVVAGFPCDVAVPGAATALAASAQAALPGGAIDVWINNAGATTYGRVMDGDDAAIAGVVSTNLAGTLLASAAAMRALAAQPGGGHLWNMDGAGSDGGATPNFAAYGATKAALTHLHKSLKAELKAAGLSGRVGLHRLSPGMVTTDLLMQGAGATPASNFFINVLAEAPADSAGFLVPRVRAVARSPPVSGPDAASVAFLTKPKALGQLVARLVTGARKGRWVPEE